MNLKNRKAFRDMLGWSEGTTIVPASDDGYNVIVGGHLFTSYADHPRVRVWIDRIHDWSTAAGRYQIKSSIFDAYKAHLHLPDFGHASQDAIANQLIGECHAWDDIDAGNIQSAIFKCSSRWASLPGNSYGQAQHPVTTLLMHFVDAGGTIA